MCGRFTLRTSAAELSRAFACEIETGWSPRYNIAPTQLVAAVRRLAAEDRRRFSLLRWGLVLPWAQNRSARSPMINARAESVADRPAFRSAFRCRRCLVLADGYYEWAKEGKEKQPYFIRMRDDRPFAFAGLWEVVREPGADPPVETCAVITTEANELTRSIHARMPVILNPADYDLWLDPAVRDPAQLLSLLRPYDSNSMRADPVDRHVNDSRNEGPQCICVEKRLF